MSFVLWLISTFLALAFRSDIRVAGAVAPTYTNQKNNITYWVPPKDISKRFIYYLSGYDGESRPIYVIEFGKWDVRATVEQGGKDLDNLRMHIRQLYYKIEQGGRFSESEEDPPNSVVIMDWSQFNLLQLASSRTVQLILKSMGYFKEIQDSISYGFFINVNSPADTIVSLARPLMGTVMERVGVFGTNRNEWQPKLLEKIPGSQIPPWYGGKANFKPVALYG